MGRAEADKQILRLVACERVYDLLCEKLHVAVKSQGAKIEADKLQTACRFGRKSPSRVASLTHRACRFDKAGLDNLGIIVRLQSAR